MLKLPEQTFWNNNNLLCPVTTELHKLVPSEGEVANKRKNRALEKFRKATNCYHDLYNNGLGNRASEFYGVFKIASSHHKKRGHYGSFFDELYALVEQKMQEIVVAAAKEQGIAYEQYVK